VEERRSRLPSPRALLIAVLVLAVPGVPYAYAREKRIAVEDRAAAVASALTHRRIHVACPGPIRRRTMYEIHEGQVWFDADGVPADETKLSASTCDGLRIVIDHAATLDFACLKWTCPRDTRRAAQALAVFTHETMHLRGTRDEGVTECQARQRVAEVAARFGVSAQGGAAIAYWQANDWQDRLPDQYRGASC
jgi:hypothetical protein